MKAPIKDFVNKAYPEGDVSQYFGGNKALYSRVVCKLDGDRKYCLEGHNGIDLVRPWGTPIFAVEDGLVVKAKDSPLGFGKAVKTINFEKGHEWTYGHLSRLDVELNQPVLAGQQIGLMGNTGFVISGATPYWEYNPYAGTHLHLGLRLIQENDKYPRTTYPNGMYAHLPFWRNGYYGAIDWTHLWTHVETPTKLQLQLTVVSLANQVISLLKRLIALKKK